MRKTISTRRLFGLCYALAVILWVVFCLGGCAVMLTHKAGGTMPQTTLTAGDLTFESFVSYQDLEWDTPPDDDPDWYLSTDNDPHILYSGGGYIETVRLYARHRLPPGSVALYYLLPGQTDYSETQKVFAHVVEPGVYQFDLGGITVSGLRIDPDSVGGVVECAVTGLPAGLGGPLFGGVESLFSSILFGIPAVKGVEFGAGFGAALLHGSEDNDPFRVTEDGEIRTVQNCAGGILGGMTTGMPLVFRVCIKPTPSISSVQQTLNIQTGKVEPLSIHGRHDPCIVTRAAPVVEAACAIALADLLREANGYA